MIQLWCTRIGLHGEDDETTRATGTSTAATGSLCAVCRLSFSVYHSQYKRIGIDYIVVVGDDTPATPTTQNIKRERNQKREEEEEEETPRFCMLFVSNTYYGRSMDTVTDTNIEVYKEL